MRPPLLMVAPNGARRSKSDHPKVPITLPEMVETARSCHTAGADALHLHIRDEHGNHSLDPGRYREALDELTKAVPDMQIQITTEAADVFSVEDQLACLESLKPRWASIAVHEIARAPELARRVYATCLEIGTKVQHILYNVEDLHLLSHWRDSAVVAPVQPSVILVLGRYAIKQNTDLHELAPFLAALPDWCDWMACAFGQNEHACLLDAAQKGGNIRVGFENSLVAADGEVWPDNAASVTALLAGLNAHRQRQGFDCAPSEPVKRIMS